MERVGAVVRMKQMERDWVKDGKPLAVPYSRAVLDMLPTTPFLDTSLPANREKKQPVHEPINELPVHPSTKHSCPSPSLVNSRVPTLPKPSHRTSRAAMS